MIKTRIVDRKGVIIIDMSFNFSELNTTSNKRPTHFIPKDFISVVRDEAVDDVSSSWFFLDFFFFFLSDSSELSSLSDDTVVELAFVLYAALSTSRTELYEEMVEAQALLPTISSCTLSIPRPNPSSLLLNFTKLVIPVPSFPNPLSSFQPIFCNIRKPKFVLFCFQCALSVSFKTISSVIFSRGQLTKKRLVKTDSMN
jgi:hypothetical protein